MKEFSRAWKSSKKPKKQRKYTFNAPKHTRRKFFSARLSKELTKKYNRRNVPVRTGDKVKIVRGQFKGTTGKIEKIDSRRIAVFIAGVERLKADGSKSQYPVHPSNLIIQELNTGDKMRNLLRKSK